MVSAWSLYKILLVVLIIAKEADIKMEASRASCDKMSFWLQRHNLCKILLAVLIGAKEADTEVGASRLRIDEMSKMMFFV